MHSAVVAALSFFVVLGIMVLVHEFGHFAVAKLCGVRVEVFSIGFGKRLFGIKLGDTDYRLSLLPLGGYVKMAGELGGDGTINVASGDEALEEILDPASKPTLAASPTRALDPGDLNSKPRWQRMLIGVAGPVANFILAFVLMIGLFMMHNEVGDYVNQPVTLDPVPANSPAARAGLQSGDRIVSLNGHANPTYEQVALGPGYEANSALPVTVERNGSAIASQIVVSAASKPEDPPLESLGIYERVQSTPVRVQELAAGMPAEAAGIKPGDLIVSLEGNQFHSVRALLAFLQLSQGRPVNLVIQRGSQTLPFTVSPVLSPDENGIMQYRLGFRPTDPPYHVEQLALPAAVHMSVDTNVHYAGAIATVLRRLFTRSDTVKQLSGPIGMARETGAAFSTPGWQATIELMALISLNLGIFNLLPIPVLDGGMIVLLLIEGLIRRDIKQEYKERIYQVAFVVIIVFFGFVMFNDVSRLPIFTHIKP